MNVKKGIILFGGICTAMGLTLSVLGVKLRRNAMKRMNMAVIEVRLEERYYRDSLQRTASLLVERCCVAEKLLMRREVELDSLMYEIEHGEVPLEDVLNSNSSKQLDMVKSLLEKLLSGADCNRCTKEILSILSVTEEFEISVSGRMMPIGGYCQRLSVMRDAISFLRVDGEFDSDGKILDLVVEESLI